MPKSEEIKDLTIDCLGEPKIASPLKKDDHLYVDESSKILVDSRSEDVNFYLNNKKTLPMFEEAGPRRRIFFSPEDITCGIVTCGGLCPGLNDVIRTIALTLSWQYGVKKVLGFRYGYQGLSSKTTAEPMELTPSVLDGIQQEGGTILGASRGPQDSGEIADTLLKYKVSILFTIGGDGTFRGAHDIAQELKRRKLPISVIGIPKTIDNDICYSERTFGFYTAVEEARKAISCAHEEAKAAWNGIGLVKLMGRDSGFIAVDATLANSDVNFCLIPEVPVELESKNGFLECLEKRIERRHHAVVVVSEGFGQDLIKDSSPQSRDASGNVKYKDVAAFLQYKIKEYFKEKNTPITLKYINPSYTIRSCSANASDSSFCLMLGQNAVHAGMAGKTDMFVGYWNHDFTHVPLSLAIGRRKQVDPNGDAWQTVVGITK